MVFIFIENQNEIEPTNNQYIQSGNFNLQIHKEKFRKKSNYLYSKPKTHQLILLLLQNKLEYPLASLGFLAPGSAHA